MVIVIIAGGSGTRLWPLSQGNHPKHLLSLTSDRSMLQSTYRRARQITPEVYIIPEMSHAQEVRHQLPEVKEHQLVVEPGRRGTASCVALALSRIKQHHPADEDVVFIHSDHHITDEVAFATSVRAAATAARAERSIALVGITPTYPATGLGYIQCGAEVRTEEDLPVYAVRAFKEKPNLATAKRYLAAGKYLWNQGLFAAPLDVWAGEFKEYAPYYYDAYLKLAEVGNDLAALSKLYLSLEPEAIDYALIEKSPRLVVVPARYDWADIGSFLDLHGILKEGKDGNALKGNVNMINCDDSMIHATDKPIIAIGLSGIIVVDTPEGLLVCAKEQSQLVGELSKKLAAPKPTS